MIAKFNKTMILAGIISLACFISSVSAQPQEAGKQPQEANKQAFKQKKQEAMENLAKELGLTAEQQAQLKEQRAQQQKQAQAARENLIAKNKELKQELEKPVVDAAKVNSLVNEISALKGQQLQLQVGSVIAMKKILTPEQYKKMETKRQERQNHMEQKGGSMRERFKEKLFSK